MRLRFPLYGKVLFWFFVNLALVAVLGGVFVGMQFRLGLDWLLAGQARLRAAVRRAGWVEESPALAPVREVVAGPLRISAETHTATLGDRPLALTRTEFELLLALARAKGRVKSRDMLFEELRGSEWEVFDRAIDMHISSLRKKLGDDPKEPRFIKTVRGVGYMLVVPES